MHTVLTFFFGGDLVKSMYGKLPGFVMTRPGSPSLRISSVSVSVSTIL